MGGAQGWLQRTVYLVSCEHPGWLRVRAALARLPGIEIVGESAVPVRAIETVTRQQPDVILLSGGCGDDDARSSLAPRIAEACPGSRLLLLAERFEPIWLQGLAGHDVHGYLEWRDVDAPKLWQSIALACTGLAAYSIAVANRLRDGAVARPCPRPAIVLSEREQAVLAGKRDGLTREQIAQRLGISVSTVKRVIRDLEERLGVETLYQVATVTSALQLN
jgi:DNA-binding NarL/FixJ family response regulator